MGQRVVRTEEFELNPMFGSRILCVDDDQYSTEWVKRSLKTAKVPAVVTAVSTGREAFTLLSRDTFDLCIFDYPLPDMTGVQLCSLMRQSGSGVPIMFLTAMNRPIDREKAVTSGADDYLCKPDDLDVFVPAVNRLLKKRRPIYVQATRSMGLSKAA